KSGALLSAEWRPGRVAAAGRAGPRRFAPATGGIAGLLRRLLGGGRCGRGPRRPGAVDETLGSREGRPRRRGVGARTGHPKNKASTAISVDWLPTRPSQKECGAESGHWPDRTAGRINSQTREIHHEKAKRPTT